MGTDGAGSHHPGTGPRSDGVRIVAHRTLWGEDFDLKTPLDGPVNGGLGMWESCATLRFPTFRTVEEPRIGRILWSTEPVQFSQPNRTLHLLQKPDISTCYRQKKRW